MGTIVAQSHRAASGSGGIFDSAKEWYAETGPRERFRSVRFDELMLDYASDTSVRSAARRLNRLRLQEDGIKPTTLRNTVEREGKAMADKMGATVQTAFSAHGFCPDGTPAEGTAIMLEPEAHREDEAVAACAAALNISQADAAEYEPIEGAVNISMDEVGVKAQAPQRSLPEGADRPKQVRQTVVHVQYGKGRYILVGNSVAQAVRLLVGFLLSNGLAGKRLVFFADGARDLHTAIHAVFGSWAHYKIILDWYHLEKKCKEQLSLALSGRHVRNAALDAALPLLWFGNTDGAIGALSQLPEKQVRNPAILQKLIEYLERVRGNVPCYALRRGLGLRNSSNLGEKANDLVVANRQKHNGMSWSREGSFGFAAVSALIHNDDLHAWVSERSVRFAPLERAETRAA
jgi:hypothetical protein